MGRMRARGPLQPRQICEGGDRRHREAGPGPSDNRPALDLLIDGSDRLLREAGGVEEAHARACGSPL